MADRPHDFRPLLVAPKDWQASSITGTPSRPGGHRVEGIHVGALAVEADTG